MEDTILFKLPFDQGMAIRDRGEPPVNGRCGSRMGEILLQFLLVNQILSHAQYQFCTDFFRQFLAPFHIAIHDMDMHTLERTTLAGDEVVIGSFYISFERGDVPDKKKVVAHGFYTVRSNENDTWVKFTSNTYQFKVHLQNLAPPAATISHEGHIAEFGPISFQSVQS